MENILAIYANTTGIRLKLKTKVAFQHIQFSPKCARWSLMHNQRKLGQTLLKQYFKGNIHLKTFTKSFFTSLQIY